ncbi:MAG: hypothetical protein KGL44_00675 [Sphingomonadales bacterium]|nr:hypothetical protein [Sphingomonadales bacterium]
MVDYFALGVTHVLLAFALWRLLNRNDLDRDPTEGDDAVPAKGNRRA